MHFFQINNEILKQRNKLTTSKCNKDTEKIKYRSNCVKLKQQNDPELLDNTPLQLAALFPNLRKQVGIKKTVTASSPRRCTQIKITTVTLLYIQKILRGKNVLNNYILHVFY